MQLWLGHWGAWLRGPWIRHCGWGHKLGIHQGHLSAWEENWGGAAGEARSGHGGSADPLRPARTAHV